MSGHEVTWLTGGRPGESYTAQCSCGKKFEATHNYKLRQSITRHINKSQKEAAA